jgi:hypothetical protein
MKFQLVSSKPRIFPSTASPIHGLEVFLLGLIRRESKCHLPFDHRDSSVSQADLITGIDVGSIADSRSVCQIPSRHIGSESDGGVVDARGVANERVCPQTGVGLRRRNPRQRERQNELNNGRRKTKQYWSNDETYSILPV